MIKSVFYLAPDGKLFSELSVEQIKNVLATGDAFVLGVQSYE